MNQSSPTIPGEAGTLRPVTADDLAQAREAGRQAAEKAVSQEAPTDPLLRVAWTAGHGSYDAVKDAVEAARSAAATWRQLGDALGENWRTVQSRYGQPDRTRRYLERQRAKDQGED